MNSDSVAHKILILSASPKQTTSLRLDEEVREIKEGLKRAQSRDLFSIESAEATRYKDIRRSILDHAPTIVHFSGHGLGQEGLIFEDESGFAKMVETEAIGGLFQLFRDQVKCVVLNACYSDSQAQEIAKHINHVVGMSQAIDDKAAIEFSVAFYDALGANKSYYFAYQLGCNAIKMAGIPQESIPQWYGEKTERVEGPKLTKEKQADSLSPKTGAEKMSGGRNINIGTGDYRETSIHDQGSYVEGDYYNHVAAKSSLTEAASEIQQLLDQLSKNNSTITMTGKMKIAGEVIEEIENNPALMQRVIGALKAGGVSAFEQALNHPAASFVIGALEEWQNSKT